MTTDYIENSVEETGVTPEEQVEGLDKDEKSIGKHWLDKDEQTQKYRRMVINWWEYEQEYQLDARLERMKDHDYYDGNQWADDDKAEVEARGQTPLTFNRTKPTIDWIVGTERRTRVDYAVLPRRKEESKDAETKTKTVKYVSDVSRVGQERSLSFKDGSISGVGWLDHGVRSDDSEEPLYISYEDWRNVWYDSHAKKRDMSDGRYLFRSKVVDYDVGVAMFPERADCIRAALQQRHEDYSEETGINPDVDEIGESSVGDAQKHRVRLISCEYRVPSKVKVLRGKDLGGLNGAIYDEENEGMRTLIEQGHASIYDSVKMVMWKMILTDPGFYVLQNERRQYNHQYFSLVPFWAYRTKKENAPYGVVRNLRDPQDDLNKRRSKALFILSTKQAILEEGAVEDVDEFIEEKDRPDGVMVVKEGKLDAVHMREERALAREHVMLMDQDAEYIESTGGVTDENRGMETNATSGKAIQARQDQGHTNTAELFDNYKYAFQLSGMITLSLIEQYYTEEKVVRLTGDKGQQEFVEVNKRTETGEIENDITATQADFIVEADNYHASVRQAMFESLGEIIGKLPPEISIQLLDMWLDLSDLPGREVMVERIRTINGQNDPDEDPDDPEVQKKKQAEAQAQQKQKQIEDRLVKLEMALKEAEVNVKDADAQKKLAEIEKILASIRTESEGTRIKKAEALNKIETSEK